MKKRGMLGLLLVAVVLYVFYLYRNVPLTEMCKPLKDAETISYIRLQLDQGAEKETQILELKDQAVIETIAAEAEKVRLRYDSPSDGVYYDPEKGDTIIVVHVNSPENQFVIKKDGSVYSKEKKYVSKNEESEELYTLLKSYF